MKSLSELSLSKLGVGLYGLCLCRASDDASYLYEIPNQNLIKF